MRLNIYGIGGKWVGSSTGDSFIGTAYDLTTALSLFDLVESKNGYAVSLHSDAPANLSGEMSVNEARKFIPTVFAKQN